jgi:methyl-accepting chemotaxis protein
MRRILGILVMIAGILGLVLSLAGLVGVWMARTTVAGYVESTIVTLDDSINTSERVMAVTEDALGATVDSVDALSTMLGASADSVGDTMPVLADLNTLMGEQLPATMTAATASLRTAQQSAEVVDTAIVSLDAFRLLLSEMPLVSNFVPPPAEPYNPEVSLADSLGDLASNLEGLPATFTEMAAGLDTADDNLATVQSSLDTMSESVDIISGSLSEYKDMVAQSQSSMENLRSVLTDFRANLTGILNGVAIGLTLALLWLLAAQVVILSQGWELYQGTAGRLDGGAGER